MITTEQLIEAVKGSSTDVEAVRYIGSFDDGDSLVTTYFLWCKRKMHIEWNGEKYTQTIKEFLDTYKNALWRIDFINGRCTYGKEKQ